MNNGMQSDRHAAQIMKRIVQVCLPAARLRSNACRKNMSKLFRLQAGSECHRAGTGTGAGCRAENRNHNGSRTGGVSAGKGCSSAASPAATTTQKPTDAQTAATRSACRSDYEKNCASVPPGGAASLQCLQKSMSKLSPSCQKVVNAVGVAGAPAAAATTAPAAVMRRHLRRWCCGRDAAARGAVCAQVGLWRGRSGAVRRCRTRRRAHRAMSGRASRISFARLQGRSRARRRNSRDYSPRNARSIGPAGRSMRRSRRS